MSKVADELPYDFDLVYDIKTKEQLWVELKQAKDKVATLEELIKFHDISQGER